MINPRVLKVGYSRIDQRGMKLYYARIGKPGGRVFKRATEALSYARRVHARWIRLYDAARRAIKEPA